MSHAYWIAAFVSSKGQPRHSITVIGSALFAAAPFGSNKHMISHSITVIGLALFAAASFGFQ